MSHADRFLRAFRKAAADGDALTAIADDAEGFAAALTNDPDGLASAIEDASHAAGGTASVPGAAFAAAACRRDGRLVASDPAFARFDLPADDLADAVRASGSEGRRLSAVVDDVRGRPVALAIAGGDKALAWPMGVEVRAALVSGAAEFAVLGVGPADSIDWPSVLAAWTFTAAEIRLAAALVRTGDLRLAAGEAGVAYETARETLASAMTKTGAGRQPAFVGQLVQLALGSLPDNDVTWRTFADTYGLTARQGKLGLLVALGATRATAAAGLGVSDQTAKADLKAIFERCGLESGAGLGRLVAETDALARLAGATDVEILGRGVAASPLRFVRRRRRPGRIAVEDHGPSDGLPVVVFHTPTTGRHLPRSFVQALRARGLRPISVDRPGFGLSSSTPGDVVDEANADLIDVLDALGLARVRLLGRSITMPMRFAADHPERIDGGVLLSATPPGVRPTSGLVATAMALALDHPSLVRAFARLVTGLSSERAILRLTDRAYAESPADLAALAEPLNRADWVRASKQGASGDGFAREFILHCDGGAIPAAAYQAEWIVLVGARDVLRAGVADPAAVWRAAAPRARVQVIENGGRLLHLSHPDDVARALVEAA